jgi:hypothetical protein
MIQRPTHDEDEDDLLQLAAQFTQSLPESRPAAIAIRSKPPTVVSKKEPATVKKSHFAQKMAQQPTSQPKLPAQVNLNTLLGDIVEKEAVIGEFKTQPRSSGFPKVFHRSERSFAKFPSVVQPKEKTIVVNSEANGIHDENVDRLSKMTVEEIKEAQQEILERLSPEIIEMLKNKNKKREPITEMAQGKFSMIFIIRNREQRRMDSFREARK